MLNNNIFFVIDNNYVQQLLVTINSIFSNNDPNKYVVNVVHIDVSQDNQKIIRNFVEGKKSKLIFHKVPDNFIDTDLMLGSRWSSVVYYKLFALFYINVEKALYLDSDIIVDGDISALFDMDMEDKYIYGVEDSGMDQVLWNEKEHFCKIGLQDINKYINAGVMLLNLKAIQKNESLESILNIYKEKFKRLTFNEQDLINMLWQDKIGLLDAKYNRLATDFRYRKDIIFSSKDIIFHYTINKPWLDVYSYSKEPYIWQVNKYLKYSDIPECRELHKKVMKINNRFYLKIKGWIKSMFCVNPGIPLKSSNLLEYLIYKL